MKITFDFATKQITIDGDESKLLDVLKEVRAIAPALSHIVINAGSSVGPLQAEATAAPVVPRVAQNGNVAPTGQTLKQFVRSLDLANAAERIAAVAFYMKHHEGRETFAPKEMGTWFTHAGLPRPTQMPVAIFDARNRSGLVESAGHGVCRLSIGGENLIVGKLNQSESRGAD